MTTIQTSSTAPMPLPPPPRAADAERALITITTRPETVFVDGQGSWLTDEQGKRHLDLVQGWAVNCLGHSPPVIAEACLLYTSRCV